MTTPSLDLLFKRVLLAVCVMTIATIAFVRLRAQRFPLPPVPPRIQTIPEQVVSIAMEVGVPPALATQLASVESGMNPLAVHRDRNGTSCGTMQLNDRYWMMACFSMMGRWA